MMRVSPVRFGLLALALSVFLCGQAAAADLATAKALYAGAAYEEALRALDEAEDASNADLVDQYRALCFLALDGQKEAEAALGRIVLRSPRYRIDAATVSPKLVELFGQVRANLLPMVALRLYADAKRQYDQKQFVEARDGFRELLGVAKEAEGPSATGGIRDVVQLGEGFLQFTEIELARASAPVAPAVAAPAITGPAVTIDAALPPSATPAPSSPTVTVGPASPVAQPAPEPAVATEAAPTAAQPAPQPGPIEPALPVLTMSPVYTAADSSVVPPVAVQRNLPRWSPAPGATPSVRGALEVVVSEEGTVESVSLPGPIAPSYDRVLVTAARDWTFRPATREGRPVKYRLVMNIVLNPPGGRRE